MKDRLPFALTMVYVVLVIVASIPIFTGNDALSGIFAVALTAPWNSLFEPLVAGEGNGTTGKGLLLVALGGAVNAALIFFVSRWIIGRFAR